MLALQFDGWIRNSFSKNKAMSAIPLTPFSGAFSKNVKAGSEPQTTKLQVGKLVDDLT